MKQINNFITEKLKLNNQSKLKDNKFWMLIFIKDISSIIKDFNDMYHKRLIFSYSEKKDAHLELYLININEFKDFFSNLSFLRKHSTDFILYEVPEELPISKSATKNEIDKYVENELNDLLQASDKWDYDNLKKRDITYFVDLTNYDINERLTLNKQSKLQVFKSKIDEFGDKYNDIIIYLKTLAKRKGLEIKFRNKTTNAGDFTIFIYDKSIKKNYLVGFDGDWNAKPDDDISFVQCAKMAEKYINDYKK